MDPQLHDEDPEPWVRAVLLQAPPFLLDRDHASVERRARAWVELQLERLVSVEFKTRFEEHCPVSGCTPDDYGQRILELPSGGSILVGIRFKGESTRFPFVDLVASTAPWPQQREECLQVVRRAFEAFSPKCLRVVGPRTGCTTGDEVIDQCFHAAELEAIAASGEVEAEGGLELRFVTESEVDRCLTIVELAYEQFRAADPVLAADVPPAEREQLITCVNQGYLTLIRHAGRDIGVLCVARNSDWLFEGLCVVEEVLLREHTGRGFAAMAQRQLARELVERGRTDLVWGTIDGKNIASRKTAERVGRAARAAWRFVEL